MKNYIDIALELLGKLPIQSINISEQDSFIILNTTGRDNYRDVLEPYMNEGDIVNIKLEQYGNKTYSTYSFMYKGIKIIQSFESTEDEINESILIKAKQILDIKQKKHEEIAEGIKIAKEIVNNKKNNA